MRTKWLHRLIKISGVLCTIGIVSSGVLYAYATHPPKTPTAATNIAELETFLTQLVASGNPPGLSIVVVKDGKLVYNRAFGLADGPKQIAATPETVYHWWSMTKIVTAMAVLQLHEQGLLNIDDPVVDYLPAFQVQAPAGSQPITIRHLLNHSSGLPDPIPAMMGWVHYALAALLAGHQRADSGTRPARLVAEPCLYRRVTPFGSHRSRSRCGSPAPGLFEWGELDGVRILSPQSVALMTGASHVLGEGPNTAAYKHGQHGLGWYVIPEEKRLRLQHHGAGPGFATTIRLYPEEGLGIAILANGTDLDRDGLGDRLAQIDWTAR